MSDLPTLVVGKGKVSALYTPNHLSALSLLHARAKRPGSGKNALSFRHYLTSVLEPETHLRTNY